MSKRTTGQRHDPFPRMHATPRGVACGRATFGRATCDRAGHRRGFSLIELLLAVFILAIGIISISALFPAGIAQQQSANDEQLGPVIAEQALGTLRSRLKPEDFGTFEEFGVFNLLNQSVANGSYVYRPAPGDWSWIRPGVILADIAATLPNDAGAVDIFSAGATPPNGIGELTEFPDGITGPSVPNGIYGIPWNSSRTGSSPPAIIVTQRERYWPAVPEGQAIISPSPYVWDVMFRRFGGKVQVAIFVYRVVGVGGAPRAYVAKQIAPNVNQPPVPFRRVPVSAATSDTTATTGPAAGLQVRAGWQQTNNSPPVAIDSLFATGTFGPLQGLLAADLPAGLVPIQSQWQLPGQWLVDGNGNVHRVTQGRRTASDPLLVRLSAPVPRVPQVQVYDDYELLGTLANDPVPQGIRSIFYVPTYDADRNQLIPVYATVREL